MKCRCGHAAEHHAMQGRNPALSFCVESACPCEAYSPKRRGPRMAPILLGALLWACGGTADPQPDTGVPVDVQIEIDPADTGPDVCYPAKQACPLPDAGDVCESLASAPVQCGGMASASWYLCPFTATSPVGQCVPGGSDNSGQYWCCQ